jgi:hypothetical protein
VAFDQNVTDYINQEIVINVLTGGMFYDFFLQMVCQALIFFALDIGEDISISSVANSTSPVTKGTFQINDNNTVTYIPPEGFLGHDIFQYQIHDIKGTLSNWANVTIHVTCT